jgi:hypothetical protein
LIVANLGTGVATAPTALVVSPALLTEGTSVEGGDIHVQGGGPWSSVLTLHAQPAPRCEEGPDSYEIVRFESANLTAMVIDATGLGGSALHLDAPDTFCGTGGAERPADLQPVVVATGLDGGAVAKNARLGVRLAGTPLGALLEQGGWTAPGGEPVASALANSAEAHLDAVRHGGVAGSTGKR